MNPSNQQAAADRYAGPKIILASVATGIVAASIVRPGAQTPVRSVTDFLNLLYDNVGGLAFVFVLVFMGDYVTKLVPQGGTKTRRRIEWTFGLLVLISGSLTAWLKHE